MKISRSTFILPVKRFVRRRLESLGYVLVRKADFDRMYAPGGPAGAPAPAPIQLLRTIVPKLKGDEANIRLLYESINKISNLPYARVEAICSALRLLHDLAVPGDIVESGTMPIQTLIAVGAMLSALRDTSRRLVLLDVAVDPVFRAEPELLAWGGNSETRSPPISRRNRISAGARRIVPELVRSGYPAENIVMGRFPEDLALVARPLAYLGVTSYTYPANRAGIGELYRRLSPGGIFAVDDEGLKAGKRDAVAEYLDDQGIALQFRRVTDTYRIGVKPAPSGDKP
jgi:hypothetical protein